MKEKILYILLTILVLASCTCDLPDPSAGNGTLVLSSLTRSGTSISQIIDDDLALTILDEDGKDYKSYKAGEIPTKIVLAPGTYTVQAYTENQETWQTDNNGLGTPCYWGSTSVTIENNYIYRMQMQVPMVNYAVSLTLPELFENLFKTYTFSLNSGGRNVNITKSQKAYFSVKDGGFSYKLEATNTDDRTSSTATISYKSVQAGKLYNMTYYYDTDANSGGLDIEITDNMETEDVPLN